MNILIGTPIHEVKDYSMERWLRNVSELEYPADLLLVDNSPDFTYIEKVKRYCAKHSIINYTIEHITVDTNACSDLRIEQAQEAIRRYVLSHGYDAWFSWECDQIIPTNALGKLVDIMQAGNFMMVLPNCWARLHPDRTSMDMGCTLLKRACLEKSDFLPHDGKAVNPSKSGIDVLFKDRVLRAGGNYVEVHGIIEPIYHLNV